eukprot:3077526-Prymnesium_polylepis.2
MTHCVDRAASPGTCARRLPLCAARRHGAHWTLRATYSLSPPGRALALARAKRIELREECIPQGHGGRLHQWRVLEVTRLAVPGEEGQQRRVHRRKLRDLLEDAVEACEVRIFLPCAAGGGGEHARPLEALEGHAHLLHGGKVSKVQVAGAGNRPLAVPRLGVV